MTTGTDQPHSATEVPPITLRLLRPDEDPAAFRSLNEEWIRRHFTLEPKDIEVLSHPKETILDKGGCIIMAYSGAQPAGCVALLPVGSGVYELSKMAVSPALRGRGLGGRLLRHALHHARSIGADQVFLGSSTKLPDATHLYASEGFVHVPREELPPMPYTRADIFMSYDLRES